MMMKNEEIELEIWEKLKDLKDYEQINTKTDWNIVKSRMGFDKRHKKISFTNYFARIAAILILATGLSFILYYIVKRVTEPQNLIAINSDNTIKNYVLPDNSLVVLNKGSKLLYNIDYNNSNRELILEGEAYFEVEHNEDFPFVVHTENSSVKVLGTKFNVRINPDNTTVSVVDGKVSLYETDNITNRSELIKNQTGIYTFTNSNILKQEYIDPNCLAWRTGILVFEDTPLNIVFKTVATYYNLDPVININTEEPFTGRFEKQKLEDVLKEIELGLASDIRILSTDKELIVTQN